MTMLNDIYNFITDHKAVLGLAAAWAIREWSTVGGWIGLKSYFLTGKSKSSNDSQPQQTKTTEIK